MSQMSLLQQKRLEYKPAVPHLLKDLSRVEFKKVPSHQRPLESLRPYFPKTLDQKPFSLEQADQKSSSPLLVGVLFSGGQAAGGHNVLAGLFDALKQIHPDSSLIGFLGGIEGVLSQKQKRLTQEEIAPFRNQGGFDLIGTGRDKIETQEQLETALKTCQKNRLDGLVIVGGDDSNTNAAVLAEYFLEKGCKTKVVGVPKTIDGDLRSKEIEIPFGFDSACKTYSEMIGNIAKDALSARKYYHFIKLMGRSASHICLECALKAQPNLALIGEEKKSLSEMVQEIVDVICKRSQAGKDYGVILIPEGLIEFIPEIHTLIEELNQWVGETIETICKKLKEPYKNFFLALPEKIQKQLLSDRDPHGNVKVSQIDTEELLIDLVMKNLKKRSDYKGKFTPQHHFFGYEGRSCFPSNFDANYCYALGHVAALAIRDQLTGVICSLQKLSGPVANWKVQAVPIVQLMHFEMRNNKEKPVIEKYLVDAKGALFLHFLHVRKSWETEDLYLYPGPIQFFGDQLLTDSGPLSLGGWKNQ